MRVEEFLQWHSYRKETNKKMYYKVFILKQMITLVGHTGVDGWRGDPGFNSWSDGLFVWG